MGYESKLYVVEKKGNLFEEKKQYAEVIAVYNMSKFDAFGGIFQNEADCYFYADDGDTEVTTDKYGDTIKEAPINEVIEYLEKYKSENEHYRRVEPLLNMLKGFNITEWNNLSVMHYGY